MKYSKALCLSLIMILAFYPPGAMLCCDSARAASAMDSAVAPDDEPDTQLPLCHVLSHSKTPDSEEPAAPACCPDPDHERNCDSPAFSKCLIRSDERQTAPSTANQYLTWILSLAPIQPQSWLPYTFLGERFELEDAIFPPPATPTLLSLSCQLTL